MSLGSNLKKARQIKGMSVMKLSELTDIADNAIRRYESDEHEPRVFTLLLIADALNVSLDALTDRDEYMLDDVARLTDANRQLRKENKFYRDKLYKLRRMLMEEDDDHEI